MMLIMYPAEAWECELKLCRESGYVAYKPVQSRKSAA
jgi:hypothetical protein